MLAANPALPAYAAETKRLEYVDVNPVLFDRDGMPRFELYMPDALHLRPMGYVGLTRILKPILTKAFETPQ